MFSAYLRNNFPPRDGTLVTFVGGRPFMQSARGTPLPLGRDSRLRALWARLRTAERGSARTPAGPIEYLAVPVGGAGVFVGVVYSNPARAELRAATRAAALAGLLVLALEAIVAWRLARGVLQPVRAVTETARAITETT